MGEPTFCICENKSADQLRLCFCCTDSTFPLLSTSKLEPLAIVCACASRFVSDMLTNHIADFLMTRLKCVCCISVTVTDPCSPNPCKNGATCEGRGDSYVCQCRPGWSGRHCTEDITDSK